MLCVQASLSSTAMDFPSWSFSGKLKITINPPPPHPTPEIGVIVSTPDGETEKKKQIGINACAMGGTITDLCVESSIWTHWWLNKQL